MNDSPQEIANRRLRAAAGQSRDLLERLPGIAAPLAGVAAICAEAVRNGNKILFCGNGGSAAECQHLATELVVRLSADRSRAALPAVALTTDTSLLTACANDFGFDAVFARQIEALAMTGDVLMLMSTSGKSPNLLAAARAARARGVRTIGWLGAEPTPLDPLLDVALHMPAPHSQRVQEAHLLCGHVLVELIEDLLPGFAR